MTKISSGIASLDTLVDSLHTGDNVVWEVDAGTSYESFIEHFIRTSFEESQQVIYVSFNRSPQSVINAVSSSMRPEYFTLIDCFTSGKGKNDNTFLRFYEKPSRATVVKILNPKSIGEFTEKLNAIEDSVAPGARYVFDSLTGMQDLWADENDTYRFFTHMCPRLYDLDTVAYWILEKDAHSQKFKANLRHITQVVFDLSKRRENLYIKALKLSGRQSREAFKPHPYEVKDGLISVTSARREPSPDIGTKIRTLRARLGMSQKELADKVDLTPSFISQLESNQISPSLNSFLQIADALGISPTSLLRENGKSDDVKWLIRREAAMKNVYRKEPGYSIFSIVAGGRSAAYITVIKPGTDLKGHFLNYAEQELIHILNGKVAVKVDTSERELEAGDSIFLEDSLPAAWTNRTDKEVELLVVRT